MGFVVLLSAVWTFSCAISILAAFLVSEKLGHRLHRLWGKGSCWLYGIHVDTLFAHHIPPGGAVLAANHQSIFDIPILASLPVDFKWVSKAEVRKVPLVGLAMVVMGNFFLTRRNSTQDMNVLRDVENGLKKGKRIVIFPEGTRSRDGKLQPLKKGAFRAAQNAGVPVCAIAIDKSFAIAPPWHFPKKWGHSVSVRVGPPLYPQAGEDTAAFMERYRKDLVRLLEESYAS